MFCLVAETTDVFDATENMMAFFMLFHLVGVSSVCTNPILYGFLNENFKKVTKIGVEGIGSRPNKQRQKAQWTQGIESLNFIDFIKPIQYTGA